jgi:hypothetical protein
MHPILSQLLPLLLTILCAVQADASQCERLHKRLLVVQRLQQQQQQQCGEKKI